MWDILLYRDVSSLVPRPGLGMRLRDIYKLQQVSVVSEFLWLRMEIQVNIRLCTRTKCTCGQRGAQFHTVLSLIPNGNMEI